MALLSRLVAHAGWWVLGVPLALLVALAATSAHDRWPGLVGDEATYLMQAESLAWDGDLRFAAEDLRRFRERRGHSPEVILHSGDGGARIVYGKPFLYAAAIAPFVRVMGERGAVLLNALVLAAAAVVAALAVRRQGSAAGPLWIAVAVFASIAFGHVFWIHPDLFLMASAAGGLAIAHLLRSSADRYGRRGGGRRALAWCAAGALLAIPAVWRPPYLLLLLPGAFLAAGTATRAGAAREAEAPRERSSTARARRTARLTFFAAGAALVAAISMGGQLLVSGSWSPYAGERRGFSELEGFPGVDFPASEWSRRVESKGNTSWLEEGSIAPNVSPALAGWNLTYLLVGRTVGLLPYFLPAVVAVLRRRWSAASRLEIAVGLAVPLAFIALRPFNFYGGAGALANRYFLPAYPLFWFGGVGAGRAVLAAVLAAPFLLSTWVAPAVYPMVPAEGYRYVSSAAHRLLPVETSQRHVKAPGRADVVHGALWVRFLDGGLVPVGDGLERLALRAGRPAEILIGRASPLDTLTIEVLGEEPVSLRVAVPGGAAARAPVAKDAGARGEPAAPARRHVVALERATARHPMWWTDEPFWLYRIVVEAGGPANGADVELRLHAPPPQGAASTAPLQGGSGAR